MIQKNTFLYSFLYGIFAIAAFAGSMGMRAAYMFGGMSIAYMFVLYSNGYDEKNKSEVILNSLPVRRDGIVTAKYVSILLFFLIGVVITGIIGAVLTTINIIPDVRFIKLSDILGIFISIGLMYAVYYPLYFKFGPLKMKIVNMVLYMLFLFGPNLILSMIEENTNNNIVLKLISIIEKNPAWMLQAFAAIVILILLILSMEISIRIYRNKEF